jgi:hypothetical protein
MSNEIARASLSDWEVESLRVTAFPAQNAEVKPDNWWQEVVGTGPETQLVQAKLGEKRFQGAFEGGQLTLRVQPGRIDWLLGRAPTPINDQPMKDVSPSVGRFDATCPRFTGLVDRWLPFGPSLNRIAFGGVVLLPVPDRATGYKRLMPYLPSVKIDPEGSRDLLYRINRPRISQTGIKDLQVNRLTTWSVGTITFKAVTITGGLQPTVTSGEGAVFSKVELDISTAAEFSGGFVPDQSQKTLKELVGLGVEIIEKGDVP